MKRPSKYRTITCVLAAIFLLFNVGIPVIVATCPMMSDDSPVTCGSCFGFTQDGSVGLRPYNDTSCCNTVFASAANKVEFLRETTSPIAADAVVLFIGMISTMEFSSHPSSFWRIETAENSSAVNDDLPVFLSSLLI